MTNTLTRTATVATSALLTAVTHAGNAVAKKPVTPTMSGLLLSTRFGRLHVTGYDWDLRITRDIPIQGSVDAVLVHAETLKRAIKNLDPKQDVELSVTVSEGALVLTQGKRVINLAGMPAEEYPPLPEPNTERSFTMTTAQMKFLADKVLPFSGKDDMLPVLSGTVQFDVVGGVLSAGSTDRFRAALAEMPVAAVEEFHVLMPDLARIAPAFTTPDNAIMVGMPKDRPAGGGWATLLSEDTTVTVRLLEGTFPKLSALFPSESTLDTQFDPVEFGKALKFVSLAVERNAAVEVEVDSNRITLTGGGESGTSMTDTVGAQVTGRDADLTMRTGFNPTFLGDVLKVFGKDPVTMHNTSTHKPALFTSETMPGLRVLLMPRRLVSNAAAA